MKKIVALILAIIYITAFSGVVLKVHYCMGKVSSVSLQSAKANLCKCGMKSQESGCCHSEYKVVKLNNDHKSFANHYQLQLPIFIVTHQNSFIDFYTSFTTDIPLACLKAPPPRYSNKIYIYNQVFRI